MSYFPWILPSLFSSSICLILMVVLWSRRQFSGVREFYFLLIAVLIWASAQLVGLFGESYEWKIVASKVQYIGIVYTPIFWYIFSFTVLEKLKFLDRKVIISIMVFPTITLCLVFTNEMHSLIWLDTKFETHKMWSQKLEHGPWFQLHTIYSYCVVTFTSLFAFINYLQSQGFKREAKTILFAPLFVVSVNFVYLQNWIEFRHIDLTPVGFSLAMLFFSWAIFRDNFLQIVPVARSALFEEMDDAIIVLDRDFRVLDLNQSASRLVGLSLKEVVHKPLNSVSINLTMLAKVVEQKYSELIIDEHHFQTSRTNLAASGKSDQGFLIVLRDITELKNAQIKLQEAREELKEANLGLQELANTDVLSGLPNRRFFFERFSFEITRSDRHQSSLCLLIIDLDHFKVINDSHGHPAGDAVLKRVAKIISQTARSVDIPGRIGGEEFGLILTETNTEGAFLVAERLRKLIEGSHEISQETTQGANHEGDKIPVTASIGLVLKEKSEMAEAVFEKADQALYKSKEDGRNRVSIYT